MYFARSKESNSRAISVIYTLEAKTLERGAVVEGYLYFGRYDCVAFSNIATSSIYARGDGKQRAFISRV